MRMVVRESAALLRVFVAAICIRGSTSVPPSYYSSFSSSYSSLSLVRTSNKHGQNSQN